MTRHFSRLLRAATILGGLAVPLLPEGAFGATAQGQQEIVDRATLAAQEILANAQAGAQVQKLLRQARAVMICPRVFRLGIIFGGGEGGGCVLLARGGQGSWSSPAFYSWVGGSAGPQLGIQDAAVMMVIRTQQGLRAVMDSQFRLGVGASVAAVTVGAGIEGAISAALNSDIVAFSQNRGLFLGLTLQGTVMSADSAGNEAYYGQPVGTVEIVLAMRANNPAADPLRAMLMRYGAPAPATAPLPPAVPAPAAYSQAGGPDYGSQPYQAPASGYAAGGPAPVQQQSLPPPR